MADDAAAPDREPGKSTPEEVVEADAQEALGAAEPESAATEVNEPTELEESYADDSDGPANEADEAAPARPGMSDVRLAILAGLVVVLPLGGLTGWLGFRVYETQQAYQQRQLLLKAGRQSALNLTSIDWQHADADVQRILDSATGTFYDDFEQRAQPYIDAVKQQRSKSVGTIAEAGLNSGSANAGQVLVAVIVKTSNAGAPEQPAHAWRMLLTMQKVGGEVKLSNVESVR